MRKILCVLAAAVGIGASGCGGGGGSDCCALSSGTYEVVNAEAFVDECLGNPAAAVGATSNLAVADGSVTLGSLSLAEIADGNYVANATYTADFAPDYDCVINEADSYEAIVIGNDVFTLYVDVTSTVAAGTECVAATGVAAFPCNSSWVWTFEKM